MIYTVLKKHSNQGLETGSAHKFTIRTLVLKIYKSSRYKSTTNTTLLTNNDNNNKTPNGSFSVTIWLS